LVTDAAKFLQSELKDMVPKNHDFYKNFEIFDFEGIVEMKDNFQAF